VPLVADGEDLAGLLGGAGHLLALADGLRHELLGEHVLAGLHRLDGHRGVQVQRQADDHGLDVRVLDQLLVVGVDLDLLAGLLFGRPAVDPQQSGADLELLLAVPVAVEGPVHVVRPDVGDGHHLEEVGVDGADQHIALVAGADDAHAERLVQRLAVAVVEGPQAGAGHQSGRDGAFEQVAPRQAPGDGRVEVLLADLFFLGSEIHILVTLLAGGVGVAVFAWRAGPRPDSQGGADRRRLGYFRLGKGCWRAGAGCCLGAGRGARNQR